MPEDAADTTSKLKFGEIDEKAYAAAVGFLIAVILRLTGYIVSIFKGKGDQGNGASAAEVKKVSISVGIMEGRLDDLHEDVVELRKGLDQIRHNQNLLFLEREKEKSR